MQHSQHRLRSLLGSAAVLLALALVGCAPGGRASSPPTTSATSSPAVFPQPTAYAPSQKGYTLNSIFMVSASDGWAVGSVNNSLLVVHYNGNQWERLNNPTGGALPAGSSELKQVVMVSATEGWAVGSARDLSNVSSGLILHYTGGVWTPQATIPDVSLSGLAMLSPTEGWAVGVTRFQQGALLHYTGGVWTRVQAFGSTLDQIVMTSPNDGWIVGTSFPSGSAEATGPSLWHYDGSAWAEAAIPGIDVVTRLSMRSASDGWAVGFKLPGAQASTTFAPAASIAGDTVFAHYDGNGWTTVQTMQRILIRGLFQDASGDGWAVGSEDTPPANGAVTGSHNLYLRCTGGQWAHVEGVEGDGGLQAVFMLSASDGWAVAGNGAILRYQQDAWEAVVSPA